MNSMTNNPARCLSPSADDGTDGGCQHFGLINWCDDAPVGLLSYILSCCHILYVYGMLGVLKYMPYSKI